MAGLVEIITNNDLVVTQKAPTYKPRQHVYHLRTWPELKEIFEEFVVILNQDPPEIIEETKLAQDIFNRRLKNAGHIYKLLRSSVESPKDKELNRATLAEKTGSKEAADDLIEFYVESPEGRKLLEDMEDLVEIAVYEFNFDLLTVEEQKVFLTNPEYIAFLRNRADKVFIEPAVRRLRYVVSFIRNLKKNDFTKDTAGFIEFLSALHGPGYSWFFSRGEIATLMRNPEIVAKEIRRLYT